MMRSVVAPTEFEEACVFVDWLETMKRMGKVIDFCHVANESYGGTRADLMRGLKLKRQGRKRGVFDYEVFLPETPTKPACEVRVELKKRVGGKVSEEQRYWQRVYECCRIQSAICHGADEAIKFVERNM